MTEPIIVFAMIVTVCAVVVNAINLDREHRRKFPWLYSKRKRHD